MQERHRLLAAALIAGAGAVVMCAIVVGNTGRDFSLAVYAAIGSGAAGYLFASWFGRDGPKGAVVALGGALATTFLSAAFAGLGVGLFIVGPMIALIAPFYVALEILSNPFALFFWSISMIITHLMMVAVRSESQRPG
jgi:hypothetical protein